MSRAFSSVGERTDVGRRRRRNEDSLRVHREAGLLVVADGMGGHPGGDMASRMAAEAVEAAAVDRGQTLAEALRVAHAALIESGRDGTGAPGMGTTCVACRLHGRLLEFAWVGDSRLYRMRGGRLVQLSRDHSLVQSLVDAGEITAEAAATHPERHVLAQCLGSATADRLKVDSETVAVEPGDRLLLCSDGLTGELADARIEAILAGEDDDRRVVEALVDAALEAGGHDNVTVVVATV